LGTSSFQISLQEGLAGIFGVPERYIDSITFKILGLSDWTGFPAPSQMDFFSFFQLNQDYTIVNWNPLESNQFHGMG